MARELSHSDFVDLSKYQFESEDVFCQRFGGKALGIVQAMHTGLSLPPSWGIASSVFTDFLERNDGLEERSFIERASQFIRQQFQQEIAAIPHDTFAVRSSGVREDGDEKSFAGVFSTELNVLKEDVPEAIAKVWYSSLSERANSYQEDRSAPAMGVLIQPMISPKFSGIAFSKHPSPTQVMDNGQIVIEYAKGMGEDIVSGKLIPTRLVGNVSELVRAHDFRWWPELFSHLQALKNVDIEFVIDQEDRFWLLQQRPISTHLASARLALEGYSRHYKRVLPFLDIELLITGCSEFLPRYLEVDATLERWMLMTTSSDGAREIWVNDLLNKYVTDAIWKNIDEDHRYLDRVRSRYAYYLSMIQSYPYERFADASRSLSDRWLEWNEFIGPIQAHYYVPMFMVDALYESLVDKLLPHFGESIKDQLFVWASEGIVTLHDSLCRDPRDPTVLAKEFGFLKCHTPYDTGYTPDEIVELQNEYEGVEETFVEVPDFSPYGDEVIRQFSALKEWISIRNREMEYLMYAYLQSAPLFQQIADDFSLPLSTIWNLSSCLIATFDKELVHSFVSNDAPETIYRYNGRTVVSKEIHWDSPCREGENKRLFGSVIYGKGKMKARARIAFDLAQVRAIYEEQKDDEPLVLITGMTTPDLIPYIRKTFSGLVTDEGGILCHAAIVAREMEIPCLVGTSLATDVFTDGDLVVIDYDRGVIFLDESNDAM